MVSNDVRTKEHLWWYLVVSGACLVVSDAYLVVSGACLVVSLHFWRCLVYVWWSLVVSGSVWRSLVHVWLRLVVFCGV